MPSIFRKTVNLEVLAEDYATQPVPEGVSFNRLQISMVNIALSISLPGLLVGAWLGVEMGLVRSLIAFACGGLILSVIALMSGLVGLRNRLSSYMIINATFGRRGALLINLALAVTTFLFFGVNAELFSSATREASVHFGYDLGEMSTSIFLIGGCVLMTMSTLLGFKSLQLVSAMVVPLLLIAFGILVYSALQDTTLARLVSVTPQGNMSLGEGISAVVGSFVVGAIVMPDFTRFARSRADTAVASFLPFLFCSTLVYTGSALAALKTGEQDLVKIMYQSGLGFSAFFLIIASSLIANAINLYGCALNLSSLLRNVAEWKLSIACGVLGLGIAMWGVLGNYTEVIFSLSIVFSPIVSLFVIDALLPGPAVGHFNAPALLACITGTGLSLMTQANWFQLTHIPTCDAILAAAVFYGATRAWQLRHSLITIAENH